MNRSLATRHSPLAARRGFTLIEMLTVVVIIGILASFVTAAAIAARKAARKFAIHQEVMQLDMAVRALQADYGDYPPDFSDWASNDSLAVDRWLLRAFPRYALTGSNTTLSQQMVNDILSNYKVNVANPAAALVVFLGDVPAVAGAYNAYSVQNPNGSGIPWRSDGFNADPTQPFSPGQPRIKAKFEFPSARVDTYLGSPYFVPPGVSAASPNSIPCAMFTSAPGWTRAAAPGATTTTTAPGTSPRSSPLPRRATWRCPT